MSGKISAKNNKKNLHMIFICISIIVILCIVILILNNIKKDNEISSVINKNITVEVGTEQISLDNFIISNEKNYDIALVTDLNTVNLLTPGSYPVEIECNDSIVKCTVNVADTTAPTAVPSENVVFKGIEVNADTLVKDIVDFSPVTVEFKNSIDYNTVGTQNITVILKDSSSNIAEIVVPVTVVEDKTPPVISGVKNLYANVGGTINYRNDITVTDDYDQNIAVTVDSGDVDISKEGIYTVKYTATDISGNTTTENAKVIVSVKTEGDENSINSAVELAEKVLESIITDDMTTKQKVTEIYRWARYNIGYSGSSDKSDYRIAAYNTLVNYSGDCYSYFAVTKLMFELLDIPNIDVVKVKNYESDSRHYWSLVSVDGGNTYYHFDATPRKGDGDDFCLVTDAFLDAYSDTHNKCHNRDKSLYPATPTENLP